MSESSRMLGGSTALILNAKYHSDEGSKELAGLEAVADCTRAGDHIAVLNIFMDPEFPPKVREAAKNSLQKAASVRVMSIGSDQPFFDLFENATLPTPLRIELGMMLLARYSVPNGETGLMKLCTDVGCHYDVREAAGLRLLKLAESNLQFSILFELATNKGVVFEARKPAGLRLISLSVEHGNFPILLRMDEMRLTDQIQLTTDVIVDLEGKADLAASKAILNAISSKDTYLLQEISDNERLDQLLRLRAKEALEKLSRPDQSLLNGLSDGDLAGKLMSRLAQNGGFPLKSDPPSFDAS